MKVYVAGKFEKKELVRAIYKRFQDLGHELSYDWTLHKPIKPYIENPDMAKIYSERELDGILGCDIFVYLSDDAGTTLNMEFGAALAFLKNNGRPKIFVVGEFNDKSPWFFNDLVVRVSTVEDMFLEVDGLR